MTVRVHPKLGLLPAIGLGLAVALLTAGCGVATPGPADYAGGPVSDPPTYLNAFPMPDTYVGGAENKGYTPIVNVTTGTGPRNLTITVGADLILWLGCGGTAGSASLTSQDIGLNWSVACGTSGDPQGVEFKTKQDIGQTVKILVTAPAADRWEVRIDAPAN
jgi:hypothetical protein